MRPSSVERNGCSPFLYDRLSEAWSSDVNGINMTRKELEFDGISQGGVKIDSIPERCPYRWRISFTVALSLVTSFGTLVGLRVHFISLILTGLAALLLIVICNATNPIATRFP